LGKVWDVISDQDAADLLVKSGGSAQAMSDMLLKEAMNKRTRDNVTIVVIHL
jgi:serine/threonine protein phosphatase PrpC